jgi:dipeptidase
MCDTLIATRLATTNGRAIFAKNSDRHPNEGQYLTLIPAKSHPAGSRVKCTYIEIPQAGQTNAVLLSKPFWMWGAEIGVNDKGVVIGNEAVFSKIPANKTPALLGMDLLRLGLERGSSAPEAMQVIIDLLEEFGQGGNCVHSGESYYHNSFIITDPRDAWVLETVDKQWAARQVQDVYSISNCITIQDQYDMASKELVGTAVQKGLAKTPQNFNFAKDYSDFIYTAFGKGRVRRATTYNILDKNKGAVTVQSMMRALRHHEGDPQGGITNVNVCMHAGWGPIRISQSTASMVVYLDEDRPIIFATGTSAPCTSIFKPMWMDASLPDTSTALSTSLGPVPAGQYDPASLFWSHERLHRATMLNYSERIQAYESDRDALEEKFIRGAFEIAKSSAAERAEYTAECFRQASLAEEEWLGRVKKIPARKGGLNHNAWMKFNREAGLPDKLLAG